MVDFVDHVARQRIEDHIATCTHRHAEVRDMFESVSTELKAMRNGTTRLLVSAFFGTLTIVGGLVSYIWMTQ